MRLRTSIVLLVVAAAAFAQAPSFEAASIKPCTSLDNGTSSNSTTATLTMTGYTLRNLIRDAYQVKDFQIAGGPKWMSDDRYDINAKASGPAKYAELMVMLQTLLAERFKLTIHRDSKPYPGYALVVAKKGLKIQLAENPKGSSMSNHNGEVTAKGASMARFADWLARQVQAPVSDETNIAGVFDFTMHYVRDEQAGAALDQPNLFGALEDQLGLKLEPRKASIEVIVVDSAEKASAN
jgi:uncharacterized protein (TIGR03435 family)